jgi:integrase
LTKRRARGEGSIFKEKSGYWCAKLTVSKGEVRKKRSKSQRVVREWLQEQRQSLKTNLPPKDEKTPYGFFLDQFVDTVVVHTLAPSTIRSYKYLIRDHIKPELGHYKLAELRPDLIQNLYRRKLDAGLSKRTVQYIHAVIRRSLNHAVKLRLLYINPASGVTAPSPKKNPPQTLLVDQAKLFLESVKDHLYYPIYLLAITTGMRKGEILGLQWEDVDLEKKIISVRHSLIDVQGQVHLGQPKSASSKRTLSLSDNVCMALRDIEGTSGFVFTTATGNPISQRNLTRHFHAALQRVGLPRTSFHTLRHTAATILLQANIHPKVVQEMLGHSTITLTLDTYSHVIPGHHDEAAAEMEQLFG